MGENPKQEVNSGGKEKISYKTKKRDILQCLEISRGGTKKEKTVRANLAPQKEGGKGGHGRGRKAFIRNTARKEKAEVELKKTKAKSPKK